MPRFYPFSAIRYDSAVGDLSDLIAPPYDVIDEERRQELLDRSRHNIVHLTLPEGEGFQRYRRAAEILGEWLDQGVLRERSDPAFLLYRQHFAVPESDEHLVRTGVLGALVLRDLGTGGVLPHERTLAAPKEDRLRLLQATAANLEPIFGSSAAGDELVAEISRRWDQASRFLDVTDDDRQTHELRLLPPDMASDIVRLVNDHNLYIIDGHHRYETALEYARSLGAEAESEAGRILIHLVPSSDPGLIILPTHRLIRDVGRDRLEDLISGLAETFRASEFESLEEALDKFNEGTHYRSFLLTMGDRHLILQVREETDEEVLDVSYLHETILPEFLDLSLEDQRSGHMIKHLKGDAALKEAMAASDGRDLGIGVRPPSLSDVERVARAGEVMPQKSTFFYPKLGSGLVLRRLA